MLDLTAIRARAEAATPGPYEWDGYGGMISHDEMSKAVGDGDVLWAHKLGGVGCRHEDQLFIAHAREDIPDLLAEIERLRGIIDDARLEERAPGHPDCGSCGGSAGTHDGEGCWVGCECVEPVALAHSRAVAVERRAQDEDRRRAQYEIPF